MSVPQYDMTEPEHRGAHCATCGTGLRYVLGVLQPCPWEGCPDYGLPPDEDADDPGPPRSEPITRREALRRVGLVALHGATDDEIGRIDAEMSGVPARNLDGAAALEHLEMRAWLELAEAAGELIDVEIEHGGPG